MAIIFGVVTYQLLSGLPNLKFLTWMRQVVIIPIIIIGGMHLHYSGVFDPAAGPEDPYLKGLAEHLSQEKAILYGAFW